MGSVRVQVLVLCLASVLVLVCACVSAGGRTVSVPELGHDRSTAPKAEISTPIEYVQFPALI